MINDLRKGLVDVYLQGWIDKEKRWGDEDSPLTLLLVFHFFLFLFFRFLLTWPSVSPMHACTFQTFFLGGAHILC